jgi:hypothetical protein
MSFLIGLQCSPCLRCKQNLRATCNCYLDLWTCDKSTTTMVGSATLRKHRVHSMRHLERTTTLFRLTSAEPLSSIRHQLHTEDRTLYNQHVRSRLDQHRECRSCQIMSSPPAHRCKEATPSNARARPPAPSIETPVCYIWC